MAKDEQKNQTGSDAGAGATGTSTANPSPTVDESTAGGSVTPQTTAPQETATQPTPKVEAPEPAQTDTPKREVVEVDAETLRKLVGGYEEMKQKVEDLEGAADVGRLARIQAARNNGKLVKNAKVNMLNGKYIVGWAIEKDDVYFDEAGKLHEDQLVKVFFFDGFDEKGVMKSTASDPMSYRTFARLVTKVEGEVVKESKDADGVVSFKVMLPDGLEIELPIIFLN